MNDNEAKHSALRNAPTLNDLVEEQHLPLLAENADYRAFLRAIWDEHAVEGSLAADNLMAARLIRERAHRFGSFSLAKEKLATIAKALGVVLRHHGCSRKQRRSTVGGVVVQDGHISDGGM
jgi:hypothetical protein